MATIAAGTAPRSDAPAADHRFAATLAIAMAIVVVAGFLVQLAMGRSSFASPLRVHVHAAAFMGWVALFVAQAWLATRGPLALHRRLGWLALAWMVLMVASAMTVIVAMARGGTVPFFFVPQQFLIADPLSLVCFVGLTGSAIVAAVLMANLIAWSPLGDAIYASVTAGSRGAAVPGLDYPPRPTRPCAPGAQGPP